MILLFILLPISIFIMFVIDHNMALKKLDLQDRARDMVDLQAEVTSTISAWVSMYENMISKIIPSYGVSDIKQKEMLHYWRKELTDLHSIDHKLTALFNKATINKDKQKVFDSINIREEFYQTYNSYIKVIDPMNIDTHYAPGKGIEYTRFTARLNNLRERISSQYLIN